MSYQRIFYLLPALMFLHACGGGSNATSLDQDNYVDLGKIAFWSFDNMSGSNAPNTKFPGLDAILNQATIAPGKVGKGVQFNPEITQSYAVISGFAPSGVDGGNIQANFPSGNISVAMWLNPTQIKTPSRYHLFGGGVYGVQSFLVQLVDGKVTFSLASDGGSYDLVGSSSSSLKEGTWTHIAVAYDGVTARIYLNGHLDSTTTLSHTVPQILNRLYIGGRPNWDSGTDGNTTFPGVIDEVLLTPKTLSATEITPLAAGTAP